MLEDNYLFDNQLLEIKTENLTIRIVENGTYLYSLCYFTLPNIYHDNDKFEITKNICLEASLLSRYPLFCFSFKSYYDEFSIYYCNDDNDDYESIAYYEEARVAINEVLKWKEFWLE